MYFTSGSDRAFESLMQGKPGFDHYESGDAGAPEDCGDCRFYRPDWKYQLDLSLKAKGLLSQMFRNCLT